MNPFFGVQFLYIVELKSLLCRRLARFTYPRRMDLYSVESPDARLSFRSADTSYGCVQGVRCIQQQWMSGRGKVRGTGFGASL